MSNGHTGATGQAVTALTLTDVSMQEAVEALREQRLPVCFEQVPLRPEQATRRADGSIDYHRTPFSLTIPAGSVAAALDALTAADRDYGWEQIGARPTYGIYPVAASALDWRVAVRDLAGSNWIDAIQELGLEEHGIGLFPRGLERQPRVMLDHFRPGEQSARHWLTLVVDVVDQGRYWNLAGLPGSRTLVVGQVAPAP